MSYSIITIHFQAESRVYTSYTDVRISCKLFFWSQQVNKNYTFDILLYLTFRCLAFLELLSHSFAVRILPNLCTFSEPLRLVYALQKHNNFTGSLKVMCEVTVLFWPLYQNVFNIGRIFLSKMSKVILINIKITYM